MRRSAEIKQSGFLQIRRSAEIKQSGFLHTPGGLQKLAVGQTG